MMMWIHLAEAFERPRPKYIRAMEVVVKLRELDLDAVAPNDGKSKEDAEP